MAGDRHCLLAKMAKIKESRGEPVKGVNQGSAWNVNAIPGHQNLIRGKWRVQKRRSVRPPGEMMAVGIVESGPLCIRSSWQHLSQGDQGVVVSRPCEFSVDAS